MILEIKSSDKMSIAGVYRTVSRAGVIPPGQDISYMYTYILHATYIEPHGSILVRGLIQL